MKDYKVLLLEPELDDLSIIKTFLEQFSEEAPERVLRLLIDRIRDLSRMPMRYPIYEKNAAFRRLVADDYLVFYKVFNSTKTVEIRRVLHHAVNIGRMLGR